MKRLLLGCICGGLYSASALAAEPYENWLKIQSQRGVEIELIRVASEKPLVATEETDPEVAAILKEVEEIEAIEEEASDLEKIEESS